MRQIIPSIIAKNQKELDERFEKIKSASIIHLDIMDGRFVKNQSLNFHFKLPREKREYQAHLMMKNPKPWIERNYEKVETIIFHIESFRKFAQVMEMIYFIKSKKKKVGIAINPTTSVKRLRPYLHLLNFVVVMTVNPGYYGSRFLPSSLRKSNKIRNMNENVKVQLDGGINDKTIERAKNYGDYFTVGSYLQESGNAKEKIKEMNEILNE